MANRKNVPWIIFMTHRNMYCWGHVWYCTVSAPVARYHIRILFQLSNFDLIPFHSENIEAILYDANVDLVLTGHIHNYQRTWPVYNLQVTPSTSNPRAPIHIVNGAVRSLP